MKIIDQRNPSKPCYINHLRIGDTFLLDGDLYYIYDKNCFVKAINLTSDNIHVFDMSVENPIQVTPVKCSICILENNEV